jgi:hypothetical protein
MSAAFAWIFVVEDETITACERSTLAAPKHCAQKTSIKTETQNLILHILSPLLSNICFSIYIFALD